MEEVLYHPIFGYYCSERNVIGRQGDYITSSDLDPIFGRILADTLHRMSKDVQPFTIVELGAGSGSLARHILEQRQFPYVIVERSSAMRRRQRQELEGLDVRWMETLPDALAGCVISNEFFDALPVHRVVRRRGRLNEICVTADFTEVEKPFESTVLNDCLSFMEEGQHADISLDARDWIKRIAASVRCGYHIAIDYGYLRDGFFARRGGTLMCYWRHQATEDPYIRIGEQDMTAHVNFSDLIDAGAEAGLNLVRFDTQMEFLIREGILDEMAKLSAVQTAASIERLSKIKQLILPGSMGERFKVLIQSKGICASSREQPTPSPRPDRN
jgi:SAM-dependent MidA family methyltransferase